MKKINKYYKLTDKIFNEIEKAVIGQHEMIEILVLGMFSKGHILLQGIPGLAKSLAVESLAQTIIGEIKFVDERLDITGANILVVDEINRISSKVRKALLKAMQERQIIINEDLYYLNQPLMVVATSNPDEGTPLSPAEKDRFMISYNVSFPKKEDEMNILKTIHILNDIRLNEIISCSEILEIQRIIEDIKITNKQFSLITDIAHRTRNFPSIKNGISTRAAMYIVILAKAKAFIDKRSKVSNNDILYSASLVIPHRIKLKENSKLSEFKITEKILKQ